MRLWHQSMLAYLPNKQLLGQHRECCALRGKGWFKKHSNVQYALNDKFEKLVAYHFLVIDEAEARGFNISDEWKNIHYRGKNLESFKINELDVDFIFNLVSKAQRRKKIYVEHDINYLQECINNLKEKKVYIDFMAMYVGGAHV